MCGRIVGCFFSEDEVIAFFFPPLERLANCLFPLPITTITPLFTIRMEFFFLISFFMVSQKRLSFPNFMAKKKKRYQALLFSSRKRRSDSGKQTGNALWYRFVFILSMPCRRNGLFIIIVLSAMSYSVLILSHLLSPMGFLFPPLLAHNILKITIACLFFSLFFLSSSLLSSTTVHFSFFGKTHTSHRHSHFSFFFLFPSN